MMMPANYSVIAENELSYVEGGSFIDWVGDRTATVWTAANVKTFNTNIVTLVGNNFTAKLVQKTLGVLFSGNTTWAQVKAMPKNLFVTGNGIGDDVFNFLGLMAAGYNLGNTTIKNTSGDVSLFPAGDKKWKDTERIVGADGKTVLGTKQIWG